MKDKAGHLLYEGDLIVYGHALGRCAGLQYGAVLKTWADEIMVRGVDADWEGHEPRLLKKARLRFSDRILRVQGTQIPREIRMLLTDAVNQGLS